MWYTPLYAPQLFQMLGHGIRLAKKCLDPSAVDHFSSQLFNSAGEATIVEFHVEFVLPCLETEPIISSLWVSNP